MKFQDGTDFDAEAVCANFDRWFNAPKSAQSPDLTYYYGALMRGFATGPNADAALYKSCEADDEATVTIKLNKPFANFPSALSLPAFSMQSPTALEKYQDDAAANPTTTEYSTAHPTGTGPFVLDSWKRGDRVTLKANPDYWGEKAKIDSLVFVAIAEPKDRATALAERRDRRLRPRRTGRRRAAEGGRLPDRQPRAVQRAVPRHEPGREAAGRHPRPSGDRLRDRQAEGRRRVHASGDEARPGVHARRRQRLRGRRGDLRLRPGEGQGPPRGGRCETARRSSSTTRATSAARTCRPRRTRST